MSIQSVIPNMRATRHAELLTLTPDPVTGRLIDSHPGIRTRPMQVLVLGASRTGTMSILTALEQLGYSEPAAILVLSVWRLAAVT